MCGVVGFLWCGLRDLARFGWARSFVLISRPPPEIALVSGFVALVVGALKDIMPF